MGALILTDALSGIANNRDVAPRLVWANRFDGAISYPEPLGKSGSRFYYTNQTGLDSLGFGSSALVTAFNGGPSTINRREIILVTGNPSVSPFYGDVITDTAADIPAVFDYSIVPNNLKGGRGNKLSVTQKKRSQPIWSTYDSAPQLWNDHIYRDQWLTKVMPALLYKFKVKLPGNMLAVLAGAGAYQGWFEHFALKFDDATVFTEARLALKTIISGGESGLRFQLAFDLFGKNLNGVTLPAGPNNLWDVRSAEGAVIQGHTFDVAIYYRPPLSKSDLVNGLTQVLITDIDTDTVVMAGSKSGVPMMGYSSSNVHRVMWNGLYTGGFPATGNISIEYSDNEAWSNRQLFPV